MIDSRRRGGGALWPVVLVTSALTTQAQTPQPRVLASLGDPQDTSNHVWETTIAAGPSKVASVYCVGSGDLIGYAMAQQVSGQWQWSYGTLPEGPGRADPAVAASLNGGFRVIAMRAPLPPPDEAATKIVWIRYNPVAGWEEEWTVVEDASGVDKPWIVAGKYEAAHVIGGQSIPEYNEYYATWTRATHFRYLRTTDGGRTYLVGDVEDDNGDPFEGNGFIQPTVSGSGDLYAAYTVDEDATDLEVRFVRGEDVDSGAGAGGVKFSALLTAASTPLVITLNHGPVIGPHLPGNASTEMAMRTVVWLVADPSNANRLFVVYHDTTSSSSNNVDIYCQTLTRNTGTGYWSAGSRVTVNQTSPSLNQNDQFIPAPWCDSSGRLHVIWYDDRNYSSPPNDQPDGAQSPSPKFDVFYSYSEDAGATFETNQELAEATPGVPAFDLSHYGTWSRHNKPGEYIGISGYGNDVWTSFLGTDADELPNNNPSVIWSSRIPFTP